MDGYDSWKAREPDYDYAEPVGECYDCGRFTVLYRTWHYSFETWFCAECLEEGPPRLRLVRRRRAD